MSEYKPIRFGMYWNELQAGSPPYWNPPTVITSEMLRQQRYEFTKNHTVSGNPSCEALNVLRNERHGYYTPSNLTMYSFEDGTQSRLWDSRWDDGAIWSSFLAKDIAREFLKDLL
jgi:hypothetical protein